MAINGGLGLGYGSKYQLLRMLGWHREYFTKEIQKAAGITCDIKWLDFGFNGANDDELLNLDFIEEQKEAWRDYWACGRRNGGLNWDAVGIADDGTYVLIEAKAHTSELHSSSQGKKESREKNAQVIKRFRGKYNIHYLPVDGKDLWTEESYQLANRLVITDFLMERGYKARLVYVLFENGYDRPDGKSDSATAEQWDAIMKKELREMGITGTAVEDMINICIINCNTEKTRKTE